MGTFIVGTVVFSVIALTAYRLIKGIKSGAGCAGCSGCSERSGCGGGGHCGGDCNDLR